MKLNKDDLAGYLFGKGVVSSTKDGLQVLENLNNFLIENLLAGNSINLGLFDYRLIETKTQYKVTAFTKGEKMCMPGKKKVKIRTTKPMKKILNPEILNPEKCEK